jgi:hypothetical protein
VSSPHQPVAAPQSVDEEEEDDEEEEEDDETEESASADQHDDEEEEDEEEDAHAAPVAAAPSDWLPAWAPYAVLALLVSVSFFVGLGFVGGPPHEPEPEAEAPAKPAAGQLKPAAPAKPAGHP